MHEAQPPQPEIVAEYLPTYDLRAMTPEEISALGHRLQAEYHRLLALDPRLSEMDPWIALSEDLCQLPFADFQHAFSVIDFLMETGDEEDGELAIYALTNLTLAHWSLSPSQRTREDRDKLMWLWVSGLQRQGELRQTTLDSLNDADRDGKINGGHLLDILGRLVQ